MKKKMPILSGEGVVDCCWVPLAAILLYVDTVGTGAVFASQSARSQNSMKLPAKCSANGVRDLL